MPASPHTEAIIVCVGGKCRRSNDHAELLALAQFTGAGVTIPCQDICKGPVVGLRYHGTIHWYRGVRGKTRRALEQFLRTGKPPKALRAAEASKRRGKVRHGRRMRSVER